ncbi:hypothetical protein DNU06_02705 [Putridiphycobacter roseus]|uniref:Uncharacterized protein n=1 Tax=Putridiphycobacter roseus TaxID=2219161 RepID=A0A2W1NLP2_9FLAO|nr:hypothetical protein [Putridiphycobacter roseus]PZE18756.1 hypothetical protein DNU06_02705 [Putridiphycobacter roseus]
MKKAFQQMNENIVAPDTIKKEVMWSAEKFLLLSSLTNHFTVEMGSTFMKLFSDVTPKSEKL